MELVQSESMSKKARIGDKVSFTFAGAQESGSVEEIYSQGTVKKALVKTLTGYKHRIEVSKLKKVKT